MRVLDVYAGASVAPVVQGMHLSCDGETGGKQVLDGVHDVVACHIT